MRPELEELPRRMKLLPLDERGYPVPWFVDYMDGKPEFRSMDGRKFIRAIKERRCWVCGEVLGTNLCFVAGPMCGINRTSSEPPSHSDCGHWSARNCPFLNNPHQVRREDDLMNNARLTEESAGMAICRDPGVTMLWVTRSYEVFNDGKDKPLIIMGEPTRVEWYCEGRSATREEVMHSIESGLPALEALAMQQAGAIEHLERCKERFYKWLPPQV